MVIVNQTTIHRPIKQLCPRFYIILVAMVTVSITPFFINRQQFSMHTFSVDSYRYSDFNKLIVQAYKHIGSSFFIQKRIYLQ